jgi:hypothetical protein
MGTHVLGRAPDGGRTVPGNRVGQQVFAILLGDLAGDSQEAEHVALKEEKLGGLRSAQARGVLNDGVQYCPGVGDVAAERRKDLAAGRGLLAGVSQLLVLRGQTLDRSGRACPRSLLERGTRRAGRVFARIDHSFLRRDLVSVCAFTLVGAMAGQWRLGSVMRSGPGCPRVGAVRRFPDEGKRRRDRGRTGRARRGAVAAVAGIPADDLRAGSDAGRAVDGSGWPERRVADHAHQHQSRDAIGG